MGGRESRRRELAIGRGERRDMAGITGEEVEEGGHDKEGR